MQIEKNESFEHSTQPKWRVVVVEDDFNLRLHLVEALKAAPDFDVIGEANKVVDAIDLVKCGPDLVLLDLGLPDGSGLEVIEALKKNDIKSKVLVITIFEDKASVLKTLRAGADGYILKDTPKESILEELRSVMAGETPISARAASHLLSIVRENEPIVKEGEGPTLTPREKELLELLARGMSRKQAARKMVISPFTVAEYVQNIYRKLSVNSRGEAVYEALQSRLIRLDSVKG